MDILGLLQRQMDRRENETIYLFVQRRAFWQGVDEAVRRADAQERLRRALVVLTVEEAKNSGQAARELL